MTHRRFSDPIRSCTSIFYDLWANFYVFESQIPSISDPPSLFFHQFAFLRPRPPSPRQHVRQHPSPSLQQFHQSSSSCSALCLVARSVR